jgi:hypothetical protein
MCLQEEASSRPLISDAVTALTFLTDPNYDPPEDIKDPLPITIPDLDRETGQKETEEDPPEDIKDPLPITIPDLDRETGQKETEGDPPEDIKDHLPIIIPDLDRETSQKETEGGHRQRQEKSR